MSLQRKMLVTNALPYANGALHLGHLVEHIQTDIWVRAQKLQGHHCISVCGDDAHGTPIMLKAEQLGITPEALTEQMRQSHEQDFKDFFIEYDSYHSTHSIENQTLAEKIYLALDAAGVIIKRTIHQAYDSIKEMFLPDRYVKGTCPRCSASDQYGDNCESCGATYNPSDLINPLSVLSQTTPVSRQSEHYFFDLPYYESFLREWTHSGVLQSEVANKLEEWFSVGLKQWDISRDAPYFGFKIPNTTDKFFYVWLDAPIGYMASFKKYTKQTGLSFEEFWQQGSETELYHFVGKDIMYFHAIFWPALLTASKHRLPTAIFTHGFLTINGQKMSKSRGTFIEARRYLDSFHPDYLRYYFATKLNGSIDDIDLNFQEFAHKVNSDLVGKVINIASRCAGFINKLFINHLSKKLIETDLYQLFLDKNKLIFTAYNNRDFAKAMREIMGLADKANQYIDAHKPWLLAKEEKNLKQVQDICTMGLNLFRILMAYLKPVIPYTVKKSEQFLNIENLDWHTLSSPLLDHSIMNFEPLMQRVDLKKIDSFL